MEKRVLLAAIISALFMAWYARLVGKWYPQASPTTQTIPGAAETPAAMSAKPVTTYPLEQEDVLSLESPDLAVEVGASSGMIRGVSLKRFSGQSEGHPLEISTGAALVHLSFAQSPMGWRLIEHSAGRLRFNASDAKGNNYNISYVIDSDNPIINIILEQVSGEQNDITLSSSWTRGDTLDQRKNPLEVSVLSKDSHGKEIHKRYLGHVRQERNVPRGTFLLSLAERYFCQSIRFKTADADVKLIPSSEGSIVAEAVMKSAATTQTITQELSIYFGPRDYFHLKRAGFEQAFPIGTLGQIGLIMLSLLSWIAKLTKSYGIAIILFASLITCAMAPFTLIGFKSMRKMQELKPQIDRIMAQHKGNTTIANREVFALYKQHRISPLSGCLPMLLQMPIFIALFQAISHFVELRGQRFLWIKDLSLPDRLSQLPIALPLLGKDLNLLPIIMAVAMYIQTKLSQGRSGQSTQDPTAKMFSGPMMSVLFGVMFYQFPSGLVLYWLTNSLMSLVWYRLAK